MFQGPGVFSFVYFRLRSGKSICGHLDMSRGTIQCSLFFDECWAKMKGISEELSQVEETTCKRSAPFQMSQSSGASLNSSTGGYITSVTGVWFGIGLLKYKGGPGREWMDSVARIRALTTCIKPIGFLLNFHSRHLRPPYISRHHMHLCL
ncbi:hypothetical protein DL98DRAFT_234232 [Cadophora sp. DSE1049]|nr:hypothetical protein DL98DRAFT_234232 [Cadophora sp. DSE1049]